MTYTAKVTKLKEEHGLSAYGLAKEIGSSPEAAANWFTRGSVPRSYAIKIARFFKVDLESLLDDEQEIKQLPQSTS